MRHRRNETNPLGFFKYLDDLGSEVRDVETLHPNDLIAQIYSCPHRLHDTLVSEDKEGSLEVLADELLAILNLASSYTGEFGTIVAARLHEKRGRPDDAGK